MDNNTLKEMQDKGVILKLGDKEYVMKYDLNAFAALEEMGDGDMDAVLRKAMTGSPSAIRKILWAGMLHAHPNMSLEHVGSLFDLGDLSTLPEQLAEKMSESLPGDGKGNSPSPAPNRAQRRTNGKKKRR